MGDPVLTPQQVDRDNYLRQLALQPNLALRKWQHLRPGEDIVVITYMTLAYGVDFALRFRQAALARHRRENIQYFTNVSDADTPKRLRAAGYRFLSKVGNTDMEVWVNPEGDEYFLIPPSKAKAPAAPPEDPAVEEARLYVKDLTADRDGLVRQYRELKALVGRPGYADAYHRFFADYNRFNVELERIQREVIPSLRKEVVEPRDQQALEVEVDRIRALDNWNVNQFLPGLNRDGRPGGAVPPPGRAANPDPDDEDD
jgi:hypothetical protein